MQAKNEAADKLIVVVSGENESVQKERKIGKKDANQFQWTKLKSHSSCCRGAKGSNHRGRRIHKDKIMRRGLTKG